MAVIKILCGIDKIQNIMMYFSSKNSVEKVIVVTQSQGVNSSPLNCPPPLWLTLPHIMTLKPPWPPNLFARTSCTNITIMTRHHK